MTPLRTGDRCGSPKGSYTWLFLRTREAEIPGARYETCWIGLCRGNGDIIIETKLRVSSFITKSLCQCGFAALARSVYEDDGSIRQRFSAQCLYEAR